MGARLLDSQSSAKLSSPIVAPRLKFMSTPSTMKSTASPSFARPRPTSMLLNSPRLQFLSTCTSCSSPPSLLTRKRKESELSLVAAMVSSSAECGTAAIGLWLEGSGHLVNKFASYSQSFTLILCTEVASASNEYFELERLGSRMEVQSKLADLRESPTNSLQSSSFFGLSRFMFDQVSFLSLIRPPKREVITMETLGNAKSLSPHAARSQGLTERRAQALQPKKPLG